MSRNAVPPNLVVRCLETPARVQGVYGPPNGKKYVIFVDDLNSECMHAAVTRS